MHLLVCLKKNTTAMQCFHLSPPLHAAAVDVWPLPLEPLHGQGQGLVELLYDAAGRVEGSWQGAVLQGVPAQRHVALLEGDQR